jgi:predicted NBD/HSP70 family sugar kinase
MSTYIFPMPIYRVGYDVALALTDAHQDTALALDAYADQLETAAAHVLDLRSYIMAHAPDTIIDTHNMDTIIVIGDEKPLDQLEGKLLWRDHSLDEPANVCGNCGCELSCSTD